MGMGKMKLLVASLFFVDLLCLPALALTLTIDNSSAACTKVGSWTVLTSADDYGSNYHRANPGTGTQKATYSFDITTPGVYQISAWWVVGSNRAYDAPYTIYNNGVNLGTVRMNQQVGRLQFNLLGTYPVEIGTLKVVLADTPSGYVTADAIKAVYVADRLLKITAPSDLALKPTSTVLVTASPLRFPPTWGVEFVLDGDFAHVTKDLSAPFQKSYTGLLKSEHTVDAYMLDETGTPQASYYAHVRFGVGDYDVALGDSITKGSQDNISSDNTSLDGRNTGGGYPPILNNLLTADKGYPHTVVNEGVSGNTALDGLNRLQPVLGRNPDSRYFLICFGRNDSFPTGLGLSPGNPGYSGSYKDYMQRIITGLRQAGKIPLLSKIPPILPLTATVNTRFQSYNLVIDELVDANSISVVPPDLYAYFAAHPQEFASDRQHFTGVGYQSMANLWFNSLAGNVPPPPPPGNGSLSGSLTTTSGGAVNLTAEGDVDWAHWGLTSATSFDHKKNVSQQISNYVKLGSATVTMLADNPTSFSWSDGTPTTSVTNTRTGIFVIGLNNGFQIRVPVGTGTRTLKLYVGAWNAKARLEATLSDNSATAYVNTSLLSSGGVTANGVFTLDFSAASAGQTLTVKYTVLTSSNTYGNITLDAATLQ